jgi:hypothetical protein
MAKSLKQIIDETAEELERQRREREELERLEREQEEAEKLRQKQEQEKEQKEQQEKQAREARQALSAQQNSRAPSGQMAQLAESRTIAEMLANFKSPFADYGESPQNAIAFQGALNQLPNFGINKIANLATRGAQSDAFSSGLVKSLANKAVADGGGYVAALGGSAGAAMHDFTHGKNPFNTTNLIKTAAAMPSNSLGAFILNKNIFNDENKRIGEEERKKFLNDKNAYEKEHPFISALGGLAVTAPMMMLGGTSAVSKASGLLPKVVNGIKTGAKGGALWGGGYSAGDSLSNNDTTLNALTNTALGTLGGSVAGALTGGTLSAFGEALKPATKPVLQALEKAHMKYFGNTDFRGMHNLTQEGLENLSKRLPNGKGNPFYKFVEQNKSFIENKPKTNLPPEDFWKAKLGIDDLSKQAEIKTPIENVKLQQQHYDHLVNHKTDSTRKDYLPEAFATLERPNEIVHDTNGKNDYLKLFYDNELKPHFSVVSPKKDGTFFSTSFRLDGDELTNKKAQGNSIASVAPTNPKVSPIPWTVPRTGNTNIPYMLEKVNELHSPFADYAGAFTGSSTSEHNTNASQQNLTQAQPFAPAQNTYQPFNLNTENSQNEQNNQQPDSVFESPYEKWKREQEERRRKLQNRFKF